MTEAAAANRVDLLELFAHHGADLNVSTTIGFGAPYAHSISKTLLMHLCSRVQPNVATIKKLVELRADVNAGQVYTDCCQF